MENGVAFSVSRCRGVLRSNPQRRASGSQGHGVRECRGSSATQLIGSKISKAPLAADKKALWWAKKIPAAHTPFPYRRPPRTEAHFQARN